MSDSFHERLVDWCCDRGICGHPYFWTDGGITLISVLHEHDFDYAPDGSGPITGSLRRSFTIIVEVDDSAYTDAYGDGMAGCDVPEDAIVALKCPVPGQRLYAGGERRLYYAVFNTDMEGYHALFS